MKIQNMLSPFNLGLRKLDNAKLQILNIEVVAKKKSKVMPTDLENAFKDYKKQLKAIMDDLAVPPGEGIRASSKITTSALGINSPKPVSFSAISAKNK